MYIAIRCSECQVPLRQVITATSEVPIEVTIEVKPCSCGSEAAWTGVEPMTEVKGQEHARGA